MSNEKNDDNLDFFFEDFNESNPAPAGSAPVEDEKLDFDFGGPLPADGGGEFEFNDMPEAPGEAELDGFGGVSQDDFNDAVADSYGDNGDYGVEYVADGEPGDIDPADLPDGAFDGDGPAADETVPAAKPNLLSKLILPVGGAVGLGLVGFMGWPMVSGFFDDGVPPPTPYANMAPPAQAPSLPPPSLPAPQAPAPVLPPVVQNAPEAPVLPGTSLNIPQQAAPTLPGVPTSGINQPSPLPAVTAAPKAEPLPSGIEAALTNLVAELRTLNSKVDDFDDRLKATKGEIFERIDRTDDKVGNVQRQVDQKLGGIEQRLAALEAARQKPVQAPKPEPKPKPAPKPRPAKTVKAPPAPKVLTDYALRGVSRDAALVQTPGGLIRVEVGRSLGGAGVAKEIRREDGGWVLVTSGGLIRP